MNVCSYNLGVHTAVHTPRKLFVRAACAGHGAFQTPGQPSCASARNPWSGSDCDTSSSEQEMTSTRGVTLVDLARGPACILRSIRSLPEAYICVRVYAQAHAVLKAFCIRSGFLHTPPGCLCLRRHCYKYVCTYVCIGIYDWLFVFPLCGFPLSLFCNCHWYICDALQVVTPSKTR